MTKKMARSAPQASFGLPTVTKPLRLGFCLVGRPEKCKFLREMESHLGNPGPYQLGFCTRNRSNRAQYAVCATAPLITRPGRGANFH
jgi:hypothetical protein